MKAEANKPDLGQKVTLLQQAISKYHLDKKDLSERCKAFEALSEFVVEYTATTKSMESVCKCALSPWTMHLLYLQDLLLKINYGPVLRECFEEWDRKFIGVLKNKSYMNPGRSEYCVGMEDLPYSICSNYGITLYINSFSNRDAKGLDLVTTSFECLDNVFSECREMLNQCIEKVENALNARPNVNSASITTIKCNDASATFDLIIKQEQKTVHWNYESKKGRDNTSFKPPQEYVIYNSSNIVLFQKEIFPKMLPPQRKSVPSERIVSGGKLVRRNKAAEVTQPYENASMVITPAVSVTTAEIAVSKRRAGHVVMSSPEEEVVSNKKVNTATAVVSDRKDIECDSSFQSMIDNHTNRLVSSNVDSPPAVGAFDPLLLAQQPVVHSMSVSKESISQVFFFSTLQKFRLFECSYLVRSYEHLLREFKMTLYLTQMTTSYLHKIRDFKFL